MSNSGRRLGILGTIRALGVFGSMKQLAYGAGGAGVETSNMPRHSKKIDPTYAMMIERYLAEGRVKCAIDELADISVGAGFYLTGDDERVVGMVGDFMEDIDMDVHNMMIAKELWAVGGCLSWVRTPSEFADLLRIPMNTITHLDATPKGELTLLKQRKIGLGTKNVTRGTMSELRYWAWNPIDTGVLGRGLMEAFVRRGAGYYYKDASSDSWKMARRPSLAEINEEVEDLMRVAITKYSPKFLIDLANFSEGEATNIKTQLGKVTWADDVVVWHKGGENKKLTPHRLSTDPRNRLDAFIKHFTDKELITMETPSVKLISETGFTEASANTAERIELRKVTAFQRYLKRKIERDVIKLFLVNGKHDGETLGFGPTQLKALNIRLNWGEETKPTLEFHDLINIFENNGISVEELRKNISKFGVEIDPATDLAELKLIRNPPKIEPIGIPEPIPGL